MLYELIKYLTRKKVRVVFNDPLITRPVSTEFGFERGTPIDRRYIERFLCDNRHQIKGKVLEVGDSTYSKKFAGGEVTSYEVLHAVPGNKSATIVGDLTNPLSLPENQIDCFICTQTFNFIFEVQKAVEGAHRLLKPGGTLLATVSGISQISRFDMDRWGDYWRFTSASVQKLFDPIFKGELQVEVFGNVLAATAYLQGVAVEDLPDESLLDECDPDYQLVICIVARKAP